MSRRLVAFALALCGCTGTGSGGTFQLAASGEVLALGGYDFPPPSPDAPAFADGWAIRFDKLLVTIDHVTFSADPDTAPTDQSQTGPIVADLDGPWAIDLHAGGPLLGKGGAGEEALPITTIGTENRNGDASFDPSLRYAFGYDLVAATSTAARLNFAADDADYAEMIEKGYVVFYIGEATWHGDACSSTDPSFDFGTLPTKVAFRFGFKSPTTYLNCQNPDNDPADAIAGEEHQRGVQARPHAQTTVQVTIHVDHPFGESVEHDSPAHFDPLAALAKDVGGRKLVTLEDAMGVDFTALRAAGRPLPWRACLPGYTPPNSSGQMSYDSGTVPHVPNAAPGSALRDLADYMTYLQSTQGHLNSDGLCFPKRNYPSPR